MTESEFQRQAQQFLEKLFLQMKTQNIVLQDHWDIDHLCFRVADEIGYQTYKSDFLKLGQLLIESEVNGRLISTFKMVKPVKFNHWSIDVVELPAPKKGKITTEGFEHIEVVSDLTFAEIQEKYPNCRFDKSGLAKYFNQELEIELEGYALKFHPLSLESVIRIEANEKVYQTLKNSSVLKILKDFSPLVAGTFPLGIAQQNSDLDILVGCDDLNAMEILITKNFSNHQNFKVQHAIISGEPSLIAAFIFENIPFEIFVQKIPATKQQAYRHFLIEEKLLKLGGDSFAQKIKNLRQQGLKTEPAFAQALNLPQDPYTELLNLQKISNEKLKVALHEYL